MDSVYLNFLNMEKYLIFHQIIIFIIPRQAAQYNLKRDREGSNMDRSVVGKQTVTEE